jgi:hypothetical protein
MYIGLIYSGPTRCATTEPGLTQITRTSSMTKATRTHTTERNDHLAETTTEKIKRESKERHEAERDKFDALVAEWLSCRAKQRDPETPQDDEVRGPIGARGYEVARQIAATLAPLPWMVWDKFEVLQHYLCDAGEGGNWTHNPEVVMLASIKADLMRFKVGE